MTAVSIMVFGEALVDIFKDDIVVGGAPFNVARHLAGFRQPTHFISAVGCDNAADLIRQEFTKFNLNDSGLQLHPAYKTGSVQVHETAQGHRFEIMANCAYDHIEGSSAIQGIAHFQQAQPAISPPIFYHGSLCLRASDAFNAFHQVTDFLKKEATTFYFDINWRAGFLSQSVVQTLLQQATFIKLSVEELEMVLAWSFIEAGNQQRLPALGRKNLAISQLFKKLTAQYVFVTYGEKGSAVFDAEGRCIAVAPAANLREVVDTVGAGDAFSSVMLLALSHGWDLSLALVRANQFAAAVCGLRGAVPSTLDFYQPFATAWGLMPSIIAHE